MIVLVLWLFGWAAVAAQPCCERLAAAIPHRSDAADVYDPDSAPAKQDHHHCTEVKAVDLVMSASTVGAPKCLTGYAAMPSRSQPLRLVADVRRTPFNYATPPPPLVVPFLTKRLRI
jgi:hypothetical protein